MASPRPNTNPMPGRRHDSERRFLHRVVVFALIVLSAGAIVLIYDGAREILVWRQLDLRGKKIDAQVIDKRELSRVRGGYLVTYSYVVERRTYTGAAVVDGTTYQQLTSGGSTQIQYLPETPGMSRATISTKRRNANQTLAFGVCFLAVVLFLLMRFLRPRKSRAGV